MLFTICDLITLKGKVLLAATVLVLEFESTPKGVSLKDNQSFSDGTDLTVERKELCFVLV